MNKIHTINLGGNPFTVDEDAYEYLQAYIRSLNKHFKNSPGCEEIISDIESRISELLAERLEGKSIVTLREVKEVIAIMGSPEEFGADPIDERRFDPERPKKERSGRRLFKDTDDKIISGVCSGIAAYFGINDPTWVRLIFAVMILGGGISFWLYIILAIILPKADSAADRLAMRGEPIDYASIAKKVQDEIEHLSSEFGSPVDPNTKRQMDAGFNSAKKVFSKGSGILASLFAFIGHIIRNILPFALKIVSIIIIVALSFMVIGLLFGWSMLWPYASHFVAGPKIAGALSMMNLFFLVMIPFVFIVMLGARMYNGSRLPKSIAAGLGGLWLLNLMGGISFGVNTARQFSSTSNSDKIVYEGKPGNDVILIEYGDKKNREDIFTLFGTAWIEDNKIVMPKVPVHIVPSDDDQFHIVQENIASGASNSEAIRRASNIQDVAKFDGKTLFVNNYMEINKNDKLRNQHASIFIHVPIGKQVKITENMWPVDGDLDGNKNGPWSFDGQQWLMTKNGLVCQDCIGQNEDNKDAEVQAAGEVQQLKDQIKVNADVLTEQVKAQTEIVKQQTEVIKSQTDNLKNKIDHQSEKIKEKVQEVKERVNN
ncbi:MAG: PspC domain-containing protein [Saprospiraceae bacterium]